MNPASSPMSDFFSPSRFLVLILTVALLLAGGPPSSYAQSSAAAPTGSKAQAPRPNVVLIMADDLGYSDLGSYGGIEIDTPHLDRLADRGLRFTQFYNTAKCGPSRTELISGLHWQRTGNFLRRTDNNVTLAEALSASGYRTMWVGKWHLEGEPSARGFDRTFGFLNGAVNFFTGVGTGGGTDNWRLDGEVYDVPEADFYTTHAFTDRAIEFVEDADAQRDEQPFFLYLAHNAPHYPLQAPEATIEKYRGRFMVGWDSLRKARYERQRAMGLIPEKWAPSPINATPAPAYPRVPRWDSLSMERRWAEDLKMATYAAQVEEMDRGIGQLMDRLEQLGERENTLVVFLSDNGGCPFNKTRTPEVPPGPADSFHNYETPWANLSNVPFRGYKRQAFEGGTATPFIASWPAEIGPKRQGRLVRQRGHILDLMPTILAAAGAEYPAGYEGREAEPLDGQSLLPVIARGKPVERERPMFWSYNRNAAVHDGRWKLVARRTEEWKLYDMQMDRTELHDLSEERPETFEELRQRYTEWAEEVGAPFPQE